MAQVRTAGWATLVALAGLGLGACTDDGPDAVPVAAVADAPTAADRGCLEAPVRTRGTAAEWYTDAADGTLQLTGEPAVPGPADEAFAEAAEAAVREALGPLEANDVSALAGSDRPCTTHRFITFEGVDGTDVAVSVWRLEHAASPGWVANEAPFTTEGDDAVTSDGPSIKVALVVAPDGTTVRVSAYGTDAQDSVSGWPTTTRAVGGPLALGPAPATVDQLVDVGRTVLEDVLDR